MHRRERRRPSGLDLGNGVKLSAEYPGKWGDSLRARVTPTADQANAKTYMLVIRDTSAGAEERYPSVSSDAKLFHPPTAKAEVIDQTVTPAA